MIFNTNHYSRARENSEVVMKFTQILYIYNSIYHISYYYIIIYHISYYYIIIYHISYYYIIIYHISYYYIIIYHIYHISYHIPYIIPYTIYHTIYHISYHTIIFTIIYIMMYNKSIISQCITSHSRKMAMGWPHGTWDFGAANNVNSSTLKLPGTLWFYQIAIEDMAQSK